MWKKNKLRKVPQKWKETVVLVFISNKLNFFWYFDKETL